MVARAESAAATAERILDAAVEVFWELPTDKISLDEVGRRAGVTVQTVIRRFGGREGLLAAGVQRESDKIRSQRLQAPVGDVASAVHVLLDHYEAFGDRVLKMLAEEDRIPRLRKIAGARARGASRVVRTDLCPCLSQAQARKPGPAPGADHRAIGSQDWQSNLGRE
jgi:AcrR family transcriptional regulator